ncbi:MAG: VPLPA-CTERM sorting domain-containing protein [bacterium]|jgi:hypothetical protein|nr:VPLPA-CTERM sorting domain-containing protein [Betaproteobacteria bacterium]
MIRKLLVSSMLLAGSLAAVPAKAVSTIAYWDTLGAPGNQASTAGAGSTNVTAASLLRGTGLTPSAAGNSFSASGWNPGEYFSLGFTVADGYKVSLDRMYLGSRSSSTGPGTMALYYSGDGCSTALATFNQSPGGNFVNSIVDLAALANLVGTVEFRIGMVAGAAANGGAVGSAGTFRVGGYFENGLFERDLQFTGTTEAVGAVVPLPAAAWLMLAGLGALATTARRRKD